MVSVSCDTRHPRASLTLTHPLSICGKGTKGATAAKRAQSPAFATDCNRQCCQWGGDNAFKPRRLNGDNDLSSHHISTSVIALAACSHIFGAIPRNICTITRASSVNYRSSASAPTASVQAVKPRIFPRCHPLAHSKSASTFFVAL